MEKPRVLVVDDDFAVAALHRGFVELHGGFTVVGVAHDGVEALRLADETDPDLVLLDIHLPDMSGLEVLRQLRARPGRPFDVIAITAARELETVRTAMAGGVLHYLVKPFTAQVLRERLDDYLRRRAEIRRTEARETELDQDQVDRLLATSRRGQAAATPPKGLSRATMEAVRAALSASAGSASAQEIGDRVGVSRVSARRYLEHLVAEGHARVAPKYGASGRPENRYLWLP
ncbi:response regulator [Nocardioides piscis]|uniref:Transcriptional regulatory protein n=1 Tax=Nocardioides piscis TaxID=2714938 RepID=A0A6G7YCV7_9ACTN|nr:response regulator [Nocardioides piscis]QIK74635.1 response regulator [Nocardioides piscis]